VSPEAPAIDLGELLSPDMGFDIQGAFQAAASDVLNDDLLELEEKIARTERILQQASSELYRELVDLSALAEQIMGCAHDHTLQEALLAGALGEMFAHHGHDHGHDGPEDNDKKSAKKQPARQTYSDLIWQFFQKKRGRQNAQTPSKY